MSSISLSQNFDKIDKRELDFLSLEYPRVLDTRLRESWNILKKSTHLKRSLKIKKAVVGQQPLVKLLRRRTMNNKQETINLLEKYKKVLNNVKPRQAPGWEVCYRCSCPNHEAHATKGKDNNKLVIGVMQSKNISKFGKYIVTYYCEAHGEKGEGLCANDKLAKIFNERWNLGTGAGSVAKKMEPTVFPLHDESWKEVKGYDGGKPKKFFAITGTHENQIYMQMAKVVKPDGKSFFPISYTQVPTHYEYPDLKGEGTFLAKNLWDPPYPPYKFHQTSKYWLKENNKDLDRKVANIHEGYEKSDEAEKVLEGWNTSLPKQAWTKYDLSIFEHYEVVNVIADNDIGSKKGFKDLANYLVTLGVNAKYVELPWEILPDTWDIKDGLLNGFPKGFSLDDYKQCIANAKTPKKREDKNDYSNIQEDANLGRWVHLKIDKKFHYDKWTRDIVHNENINLWYKNDTETRDSRGRFVPNACNYLHEVGCEKVEGLAYRPVDQEYVYEGKKKFVNSYIPYKPDEITEEQYDESIIQPFLHQLRILTNFEEEAKDFFLDKVACIVQKPEINIGFATLIVSNGEGTGKTSLWKCISEINGGDDYVAWIRSRDIFHQFRSWMADRSIIICNEVRIEGNERDKNKLVDNLKELITDETHTVEKKNVNPFQVKNEFTLFMSSNHDTLGVVKKKDGRRYFVLDCLMTRNEINEEFPNHFKDLRALSEDKEKLKHLRYYFKFKHKISEYFLKTGHYEPLETVGKINMAKASQSQLYNNLDERLYNKQAPFKNDIVNTREVYEFLRNEDRDKGNTYWKEADESTLREYFKARGRILNKGNDLPNMRGGNERTRGWWALRKADWWLKQKPHHYRLHLRGELLAPSFENQQQEELFTQGEESNEQEGTG